jgi:hypothetical protein
VFLVAHANGFRRNATTLPGPSVIRDDRRRNCACIFNRGNKQLLDWRSGLFCRRGLGFFFTSGRRNLDRCELFPEAGFDRVGVGGDQRVLGRKVLVDPICGIVGGFGFDPSSGRSSESFVGDGVDRSAWLEPGKKSQVVSDG